MSARQLILEEQIQCHGLRDGGHSMAEYHDPMFMFLYVINNMFRDMNENNGVIRDTSVRVITTQKPCCLSLAFRQSGSTIGNHFQHRTMVND